MNDLIGEIAEKSRQLDMSVKRLRKSGEEYAKAERDYKVLLHQEILKLREKRVAVGVIDKICYGIPTVAEARFNRDVAEAVYKANQESINALKLQIRILDSQIDREWSRA